MNGCNIVVSFADDRLDRPTLMGQLAQGSAARHRWPVPSSTWASASALTRNSLLRKRLGLDGRARSD
jgi:hypothetical protein